MIRKKKDELSPYMDVLGRVGTIKIFNPPFPVSRLGIQCPTLIHIYVMFVGCGLMFFLKIPDWLVCYARVFHACINAFVKKCMCY